MAAADGRLHPTAARHKAIAPIDVRHESAVPRFRTHEACSSFDAMCHERKTGNATQRAFAHSVRTTRPKTSRLLTNSCAARAS